MGYSKGNRKGREAATFEFAWVKVWGNSTYAFSDKLLNNESVNRFMFKQFFAEKASLKLSQASRATTTRWTTTRRARALATRAAAPAAKIAWAATRARALALATAAAVARPLRVAHLPVLAALGRREVYRCGDEAFFRHARSSSPFSAFVFPRGWAGWTRTQAHTHRYTYAIVVCAGQGPKAEGRRRQGGHACTYP